jgi:hypothetical protein
MYKGQKRGAKNVQRTEKSKATIANEQRREDELFV